MAPFLDIAVGDHMYNPSKGAKIKSLEAAAAILLRERIPTLSASGTTLNSGKKDTYD